MKFGCMRFFQFLIISLLFLLVSCEENTIEPKVDYGYEYAPLSLGLVQNFVADTIVVDDFTGKMDTSSTWFKDSVISLVGNEFTLLRKKSVDSFLTVSSSLLFRVEKNETQLITALQNQSLINLIFPNPVNASWDGNLYNSNSKATFQIVKKHASYNHLETNVSNVLEVNQLEEINLIEEQIINEFYAPNMGLLLREETFWEKDIQSGKIVGGYKIIVSRI
jgi:hypothetical protein